MLLEKYGGDFILMFNVDQRLPKYVVVYKVAWTYKPLQTKVVVSKWPRKSDYLLNLLLGV